MCRANQNLRAGWIAAALAIFALAASKVAPADEPDWSRQPYRVQVLLAIDGPGQTVLELARTLPDFLTARTETAIGPLWQLEIQVAQATARHRVLHELGTLTADPSEEFAFVREKLVLLSVEAGADGYTCEGREFDRYTGRWGPVVRRNTLQRDVVGEQLFQLLQRVVAPLAQLEASPDGKRVAISLRGSNLPQVSSDSRGVRPGDVFLPILRRTSRTGEVLPKGLQVIPWTFVEVAAVRDDGTAEGRIQSGAARPLAARRRGRIEQLGIAVRGDPAPTTVKLVSRSKPDSPPVGYSFFVKHETDEEKQIGTTNEAGVLDVSPGPSTVQTLLVRHGTVLLARVPIAAGYEQEVVVPVLDDAARLQIETRLGAMREELIDVVARRSILMSRIRRKIEAGDFTEAQKLMTLLNQLPGRNQFGEKLSRERRLFQSSDQRVQKRLDQVIKGTETALGQYLDPRPIRRLEEELLSAQRKKSEG